MATLERNYLLSPNCNVLQPEDTVNCCSRLPELLNSKIFDKDSPPSIEDKVVPSYTVGGPLKEGIKT